MKVKDLFKSDLEKNIVLVALLLIIAGLVGTAYFWNKDRNLSTRLTSQGSQIDSQQSDNDSLNKQLSDQKSQYSDLRQAVISEHLKTGQIDLSACGTPIVPSYNDAVKALSDPSTPLAKQEACDQSVYDSFIQDYVAQYKY